VEDRWFEPTSRHVGTFGKYLLVVACMT